ncbi:hypothetical protein [Hydrocarboniphaga sp.]|uniref:hypothetical protein n=1 Tax=Hydrocarboniphaga sp. TaxID=2033016 RepID=UPI002636ED60|nr:hypothetical protein [Hydrocarboniphaga sp.]
MKAEMVSVQHDGTLIAKDIPARLETVRVPGDIRAWRGHLDLTPKQMTIFFKSPGPYVMIFSDKRSGEFHISQVTDGAATFEGSGEIK